MRNTLSYLEDDDEREEQEAKRSRAISALSAIAKEARGERPADVDMDLTNDPEVLGEQAFSNYGRDLRAVGAGEGPAAKVIDPGDQMDPESFEFAARHPSQVKPNRTVEDDGAALDRFGQNDDTGAPIAAHRVELPEVVITADPDQIPQRPTPAREEPLSLKWPEPGFRPDAIRGLTGKEPPPAAAKTAATEPEDDGPAISPWAVLAALATGGQNAGKAVANVGQAYAQQRKEWSAGKRQQAQDAEAKAFKDAQIRRMDSAGQGNPLDAERVEIARRNADLRERSLGTGERKIGLQEQSREDKLSPDTDFSKTRTAMAGNTAASATDARIRKQNELAPISADTARLIASERADATADQRHLHAAEVAGDAATRSGAVSDATQPNRLEIKGTSSPSEKRAQQQDDIAHAPMPGITIEDEGAWRALNPTHAERSKTTQYVKGIQTAINAVDQMIQLRRKNGRQVFSNVDKETMSSLQKQAIAGATTTGQSGILNGSEFPRYAADIPDGSLGKSDAIDGLVNAAGLGKNQDTVLNKLVASRNSFETGLNAGLRLGGARLSTADDALPRAPVSGPDDDDADMWSKFLVGGGR